MDEKFMPVSLWSHIVLGLKGADRDIFGVIWEKAKDWSNECDYSISKMSKATGYSKQAIIRSLDNLEKSEYIFSWKSQKDKRRRAYAPNFPLVRKMRQKTDLAGFTLREVDGSLYSQEVKYDKALQALLNNDWLHVDK